MNKSFLKNTTILTLYILFLYTIVSILPTPILITQAEAVSIKNEELVKGLGIALGLILMAKLGQSMDENDVESNIDIRENSDLNIDLLARVIYAEARGEPYNGQVAVGAVVLNRIESSDFPNTVHAVVYQDGQFSSVTDGQINLIPNSTAYRAANDAINGIDPSNGALFFYNPDTAKNSEWFSGRIITAEIGQHRFTK